MEQTEYPAMSGHNTICTATALLEAGVVPMTEPVSEFSIDTPAGLVGVTAKCEGEWACLTRVTALGSERAPVGPRIAPGHARAARQLCEAHHRRRFAC